MQTFNTNTDDMVRSSRFLVTTHDRANAPVHLRPQAAGLITCIADQALLAALRDDVHQQIGPAPRLKPRRTVPRAALPASRSNAR
ncbi:hypothetical protein [Paludibaculum fermentans]|uniref:Uncharacterized protein n=1 Tax=Paludibaculum fermentans TaxID=1473598 RepID=A0A7S7NNC2_PALFE|nr:hypothetical protein [Paludibaculum fermentans]QOY86803.1 hypothetical protein IRI77_29070 [Paludibaculum fermentans]